jgi:hypothetical protein
MSPSNLCELCQGAAITTRYFEDGECWIADCVICRVPMVVWRQHDPVPCDEVRQDLLARLSTVADTFFEGRPWYFDDHMRKIPDHYHAHARSREAAEVARAKR